MGRRKPPSTPRAKCAYVDAKGKRCGRYPARGLTLCRDHHERVKVPVLTSVTRQPVWRNLSAEGQRRIDDLVQDPDLLNPRAPLAVQSYLTQQAAIPSDNLIEAMARRIALAEGRKKGITAAEVEVSAGHRELASWKLHREGADMVAQLGERQDQAVRNNEVRRTFVLAILPLWRELFEGLDKSLSRHCSAPVRELILVDLEALFGTFAAQALAHGDDVARRR